ncbi:MAG: hypothetical protein ACJAVV_003211 [Alphaproteobacteria bacterium]|jgi:hypothetical protein
MDSIEHSADDIKTLVDGAGFYFSLPIFWLVLIITI